MRIIAWPMRSSRRGNPCNDLLYAEMARIGVDVEEFSIRALFLRRFDILHIHWPDTMFARERLGAALVRSAALLTILGIARAKRTRIVWTVHNATPHERWRPRYESFMERCFAARVDGVIALTATSARETVGRLPARGLPPRFVIPHGDYRGVYPDAVSREEARRRLSLPLDAKIAVFLGFIRPYKNVGHLISIFRQVPDSDWRLVIAGKPRDRGLENLLRELAVPDQRIRLELGFVPDDQVQIVLGAADLVVLPFTDIHNSGSAWLALSFSRPLLVPDRGSMRELRDVAGEQWVRTYDGQLDADRLVDAMRWANDETRPAELVLATPSWHDIAAQTVTAYRVVTGNEGAAEST